MPLINSAATPCSTKKSSEEWEDVTNSLQPKPDWFIPKQNSFEKPQCQSQRATTASHSQPRAVKAFVEPNQVSTAAFRSDSRSDATKINPRATSEASVGTTSPDLALGWRRTKYGWQKIKEPTKPPVRFRYQVAEIHPGLWALLILLSTILTLIFFAAETEEPGPQNSNEDHEEANS